MKESMTVTIDPEIKKALVKEAKDQRRPLSWVCNEIFIKHFEYSVIKINGISSNASLNVEGVGSIETEQKDCSIIIKRNEGENHGR